MRQLLNFSSILKYFKKYKFYFITLGAIFFLFFFLFNNSNNIEAATFGWLQTTWSGNASTTATANHTSNQSGWSFFFSKSDNLTTDNNELKVATSSGAVRTQTLDADFNQGVATNAYVSSGSVIMKKPVGATCSVDVDCATNYCVGTPSLCQVPPVECDGSNGEFVCGNICTYKGDIYATVQIGPQCWFAENIRVTVYPDDSPITKGNPINGQSFGNSTSANYSCPPNDVNGYTNGEDCAAAANELKLGMLYQSRAALNGASVVASGLGPRGICPANWHIPTDDQTVNSDLGLLISTVSGISGCSGNEATCLRVGGTTGFNLPYAGYRMADGWYFRRSEGVRLWTASDDLPGWPRWDNFIGSTVTRNNSIDMGASVRCVHD